MPSPQVLSIGGAAPSATVTEKPLCRAAMAAANPAGPPPTITTSVSECAKLIQFTSRFRIEGKDDNRRNRQRTTGIVLVLCMDAFIEPYDAHREVSALPRICIGVVNNAAADLARLLK